MVTWPPGPVPEPRTVINKTGFNQPRGILYDGSNIWVTDYNADVLHKLDSAGNILATVSTGNGPYYPAFDGTNIWVPNHDDFSVTVVRVKSTSGEPLDNPFVLATLTGNGLIQPFAAAFDGQRVLVTSTSSYSGVASVWKAADLTQIGSLTIPGDPAYFVCSDGVDFWITAHLGASFYGVLVRY